MAMSLLLYCCGGKSRKKPKENINSKHEPTNKPNKPVLKQDKPSIYSPLSSQLSVDSTDNGSVKLRNEPIRRHLVFSEPPSMDNNPRRPVHTKSVIHKSLRFDDTIKTNLDRKVRGGSLHCSRTMSYVSKRNNPILNNTDSNNSNNHNNSSMRRSSLYIFRAAEETIVTPFAQILSSLRKILINFKTITDDLNLTTEEENKGETKPAGEDEVPNEDTNERKIANDTIKELEWCLQRLESMSTGRSVSNMASVKFRDIINNELSSVFSNQVSDYIKTFLESSMEDTTSVSSVADLYKKDSLESAPESFLGDEASGITKVRIAPSLLRHHSSHLHHKTSHGSSFRRSDTGVIEEEKDEEESALEKTLTADQKSLPLCGIPLKDEKDVCKILEEDLMKWGLDIFDLHEKSEQHSLVVVSYQIFKYHNFFAEYKVDPAVFVKFLLTVEAAYQNNPYHNSIHAADVTQSAAVLMEFESLKSGFTSFEVFAVIMACIIHDVDHPGVTNHYLINTSHELATLYNDISVLENHHLATGFKILERPDCRVLQNFVDQDKKNLRKMIISMVLATDLAKHVTLLADLKTMLETMSVSRDGELSLNSYEDRLLVMKSLVHCSDISNPIKYLPIYEKWIDRITQEFFLQGDKERERMLEISPLCDKETATIPASQVSFIRYVVHPFWETFIELIEENSVDFINILSSNLERYEELARQDKIVDPNN